jgi:invasion protein IalB
MTAFRLRAAAAVALLSLVAAGAPACPALAQSAAPLPRPAGATPASSPASSPAPAPPSAPDQTTASFADWLLRCVASTPRRICEIVQTVNAEVAGGQGAGQRQTVMQVALGRIEPGAPWRLTVVLPNNVDLTGPAKVEPASGPSLATLAWQRCVPIGCFASLDLTEAALSQLRGQAEPGHVAFKDGAGREAQIAVSFRGFVQAVDALARER